MLKVYYVFFFFPFILFAVGTFSFFTLFLLVWDGFCIVFFI